MRINARPPEIMVDSVTRAPYVLLDDVIQFCENTYDLARSRTIQERRIIAAMTESFRSTKRQINGTAYDSAQVGHWMPKHLRDLPNEYLSGAPIGEYGPTVMDSSSIPLEVDPELERILREEDDFDNLVTMGWTEEAARAAAELRTVELKAREG